MDFFNKISLADTNCLDIIFLFYSPDTLFLDDANCIDAIFLFSSPDALFLADANYLAPYIYIYIY